jgi:hypothetical protein
MIRKWNVFFYSLVLPYHLINAHRKVDPRVKTNNDRV